MYLMVFDDPGYLTALDRAHWRRYHRSTSPTAFQLPLSNREINTPIMAQKGKLHLFMARGQSLEYYYQLRKSGFYKVHFIKAIYFLVPF